MEKVKIEWLAGEDGEVGGFRAWVQDHYVDLCDCDTDAKDNCEDCTCGLARIPNEEMQLLTEFEPCDECPCSKEEALEIIIDKLGFKLEYLNGRN